VGCELAAEVRVVSRHNVDVANSGQVYFDGAMKYVAHSHGCDKRSRMCSLAGIGSRSASKQKLVNLRHPSEYVATVEGAMPRLKKLSLVP